MKKIIAYVYNSYSDPLFQSNLYKYIYHYQSLNSATTKIVLITFEQREFKIENSERSAISERLKKINILWVPLKWHTGWPKLVVKAFDLGISTFLVLRYRLRGYNKILSLGTVSGGFSQLLSDILVMEHFNYQYEPHGEFLKDFNQIGKVAFGLLHFLENRIGLKAKIVATGTKHMLHRLSKIGRRGDVFLVPSCVDSEVFKYSSTSRKRIRQECGISNEQTVFVYPGKLGGIYYDQELIDAMGVINAGIQNSFFLILTGQPHHHIGNRLEKVGIPSTSFRILKSSFEDVPMYLSASDFGMVSIPPLPSQKFRSPIKVGEFLCCGLPYLVCRGVSEDDTIAETFNVGVVVKDFAEESISSSLPAIGKFLDEEKEDLRNRCREAGISYRGFEKLNTKMGIALNRL